MENFAIGIAPGVGAEGVKGIVSAWRLINA